MYFWETSHGASLQDLTRRHCSAPTRVIIIIIIIITHKLSITFSNLNPYNIWKPFKCLPALYCVSVNVSSLQLFFAESHCASWGCSKYITFPGSLIKYQKYIPDCSYYLYRFDKILYSEAPSGTLLLSLDRILVQSIKATNTVLSRCLNLTLWNFLVPIYVGGESHSENKMFCP